MPERTDPPKKRRIGPSLEQLAGYRLLGLDPHDTYYGGAYRSLANFVKSSAEQQGYWVKRREAPESIEKAGAIPVPGVPQLGATMAMGLIKGLMDLVGIGPETREAVGEPQPGAAEIDPTDPTVDPAALGITLTGREQRTRALRRTLTSTKLALQSPTGIPTFSGIELGVQTGEILPAATTADHVADNIAVLLANIGVFAPAGAASMGAASALPAEQAAAQAAARTASAAKFVGKFPGATGFAEAIAGKFGVPAEQTLQILGNLGLDVGIGGLYGLAEGLGHEAVTGEDAPTGTYVGFGMAAGGILGGLIHGYGWNKLRLAQRTAAAVESAAAVGTRAPLVVGDVVEGYTFKGYKRNGQPMWHKDGKFAKGPSADALEQKGVALVRDLTERIQAQQQAAADALEVVSPETWPEDLVPKAQTIYATMADYWPQFENWVTMLRRTRGQEVADLVLQRQLDQFKLMSMDATLPMTQRTTAAARALAIEQHLGTAALEAERFAVERAANELAHQGNVRGRAWLEEELARQRSLRNNAVSQRAEQLFTEGQPQAEHAAVHRRAVQEGKRMSRGLGPGSKVIADGQVVEVVDRPYMGVARARTLGDAVDGGELIAVDLTQASPIPKPGSVAWMSDTYQAQGKGLLDVKAVDVEKGTFTALDSFKPEDGLMEYPLAEIYALDDTPAYRKTMEQVKAEIARLLQEPAETTSPVTPTEAVTTSGEPVVITEVGPETVKVQPRTGKAKTVKKEQIKRGKGTPAAAGAPTREVLPFTAGQLPTRAAERNKLIYVQVPDKMADGFEQAWVGGTMREWLVSNSPAAEALGNPITTSVLPTSPWREGVRLYALEIASKQVPKRLYTPEANNVLSLVGGTGKKVSSYESTINLPVKTIQNGQLYNVPENLYVQAVLDEEALGRMTLAQQREYLRKLLVLNDEVWTEVAEPAARARQARSAQRAATAANAGREAAQAEVTHARESAEALEAAIGKLHADDAVEHATIEQSIAMQSDDVDVRTLFDRMGVTEETEAFYRKEIGDIFPSDAKTIPEEELVFLHNENPGQRLVVVARRAPAMRSTEGGTVRQPWVTDYYQVISVDAEGAELARWQVNTVDDVMRLVGEGGYAQELLYHGRGRYVHRSNPKLSGEIIPIANRAVPGEEVEAVITRRAETPRIKREGHMVLQGTPEEAAALQPFAKKHGLTIELSENAPGDPLDIRIRPASETSRKKQGLPPNLPPMSPEAVAAAEAAGPQALREAVAQQHFADLRAFAQDVKEAGLISGRQAQMLIEEVPRRTTPEGRQILVDVARAEGAITEAEATLLEANLKGVTTETEGVWAKVNRKMEDVGSGAIVYRNVAKKRFASWEEAEAWLNSEGLVAAEFDRALLDINSPVARFSKLPPIEKVAADAEALLELHPEVEWLAKRFYNEQRYIPDALKEYASRFGRAYEEQLGVAPFERDMREILGIRTVEDLTPKMAKVGDIADRDLSNVNRYIEGEVATASETQVINRYFWDKLEGQKMQPKETRHVTPRNWVPPEEIPGHYAGLVVRHDPPGRRVLQSSVRLMESQERVTAWTSAALRAVQHGDASFNVFSPDHVSYARIKATKVPVRIVDPDVAGRQVMVRDPYGSEFLLPKSEVTLIRPKATSADAVQYEIAAGLADGRYGGFERARAPLGKGQFEEDLGLLGTNSYRAVRERGLPNLQERWDHLVDPKTGKVKAGLEDDFERFMLDLERAQWLGHVEFVKGRGDKQKFVTLFDEFVKAVPKERQPQVRYALYQRAKQRWGNTPVGEAIARAASTKIGRSKAEPYALTKKQVEGLRQWAKDWGYVNPDKVPLAYLAEKALVDSPLHPIVNRVVARLRKDAGFLRIGKAMDDMGFPYNSVEFSWPKGGDINTFTRYFGISHNIAEKHPMSRLFMDGIRAAEEHELRRTSSADSFLRKLWHDYGYSDDDLRVLKVALGEHATWEEAAAAGLDERFAPGFVEWRNEFGRWQEDLVRYYLRRNLQPLEFDPQNPTMVAWVQQELKLDAAKIRKGALLFAPDPKTAGRVGASRAASSIKRWTTDEIEEFLGLMRNYAKAADLPEGTPQEYAQIFDFWKGWKIDNYWPVIHEGNFGIFKIGADGTEELVGWTRSFPDAVDAMRDLHKRGLINVFDDKLRVAQTRDYVDDILVRRTPNGELPRVVRELAAEHSFNPDEVRALFVRAEGVPRDVIRAPLVVNALQRKIKLPSILDDPAREFQIYAARVARGHYRLDVMDSWNMLNNHRLDQALSDQVGTARLFSRDMKNLRGYLEDELLPVALGVRGRAERAADSFAGFWLSVQHSPKWALGKITGTTKDIPWDAWRAIWDTQYRARSVAGNLIGFQSSFRLFGSLSSAIANASQHWINTAPLLIGDGVNEMEAMRLAMRAYRDGVRLWKVNTANEARALAGRPVRQLSPELRALQELVDDSNVLLMPGKHLAGAGGTSWGALAHEVQIPYGRSKLARTWEIADYAGMLMFNGAERVNRMGALVAGYQKAITHMGMDHRAAIQYAKRLVRDTQFLYDDLAMPALFHKLGPAGRLLFQFKGYIWNQVSLEAKLARAAATGDAEAMRRLTGHLGAYFVLGGARGLASHPVISSLAAIGLGAAGLFGLPKPAGNLSEWIQYKSREARLQRTAPEDVMENKLAYHYSDLLVHGVPALLGWSLGQRIGVSGQEIANLLEFNPNTLGPHLSTYWDFLAMMNEYARTAHGSAGTRGAAAGAVAATVLPAAVTVPTLAVAGAALQAKEARSPLRPGGVGSFLITGQKGYRSMAGAILGGYLASGGHELDLATFINSSESGKAWLNRALPTMARAWNNAVDIYTDQSVLDIDGKPQHLPPGRDTWEETVTAFANLPSIRREEYRAALGYIVGTNDKVVRERRAYTEAIGLAFKNGDMEKAYNLIIEAQEAGINLDETSIQREIDARTKEAIQSVRERVTTEARYPE